MAKEFLRAEEGRMRGAQFNDENGEEPRMEKQDEGSVTIEGLKCKERVSSGH